MGDDTPRNGLKTVLGGLKAGEKAPPEPRAVQLPLLGQSENDETRDAAVAQQDSAEPAAQAMKVPGRPGRPKGSRNRRTEQWADYILASFPSPLVTLARIINMSTPKVAAKYRMSLAEAIRLQMTAAKELAPYLHQKKPLAIQGEGLAPINLIIGHIDGGAAAEAQGGLTVEGTFVTDDGAEDDSEV